MLLADEKTLTKFNQFTYPAGPEYLCYRMCLRTPKPYSEDKTLISKQDAVRGWMLTSQSKIDDCRYMLFKNYDRMCQWTTNK